jgi:hypothetical protein
MNADSENCCSDDRVGGSTARNICLLPLDDHKYHIKFFNSLKTEQMNEERRRKKAAESNHAKFQVSLPSL